MLLLKFLVVIFSVAFGYVPWAIPQFIQNMPENDKKYIMGITIYATCVILICIFG